MLRPQEGRYLQKRRNCFKTEMAPCPFGFALQNSDRNFSADFRGRNYTNSTLSEKFEVFQSANQAQSKGLGFSILAQYSPSSKSVKRKRRRWQHEKLQGVRNAISPDA
jgi:hypothetical protein